MSRRTLVVGVGNLLRQDDGLGIHAIRALGGVVPPGVEVVDAGTSVLDVLLETDGVGRRIIVDAVAGGEAPGAIYRVPASALIDGGGSALIPPPLPPGGEGEVPTPSVGRDLNARPCAAHSAPSRREVAGTRANLSLHDVGLPAALMLARAARIHLDGTVVIGMEPASLDWGMELSPVVQARLPALVETVLAEIAREEA